MIGWDAVGGLSAGGFSIGFLLGRVGRRGVLAGVVTTLILLYLPTSVCLGPPGWMHPFVNARQYFPFIVIDSGCFGFCGGVVSGYANPSRARVLIYPALVGVFALLCAAAELQSAVHDHAWQPVHDDGWYLCHDDPLPTQAEGPGWVGGDTDAWGHVLVYTLAADGKSATLASNGPDGQPGTADDLVWEAPRDCD